MRSPGELLENHSIIVRGGRILDVLPSVFVRDRYEVAQSWERSNHMLLPGLVDARTQIVPDPVNPHISNHVGDQALLGIAAMLHGGATCFCSTGYHPEEIAATAAAQGLRAVIGIPLAEHPSPWARGADDYLSRALRFRDDFNGHPLIATAFAPAAVASISDAMFGRIATLVDELDASVLLSLHESAAAIEESLRLHGLRPMDRLQAMGLLTPALTGAGLVQITDSDLELAQRSGIAATFCINSTMVGGLGPPPVQTWAGTRLRLSLGTGRTDGALAPDLWSELKLFALLVNAPDDQVGRRRALTAWDALACVTCGAAAALGLDAEIGTIESGKWADLCCVDLRTPAMVRPVVAAADRLVFGGGRDAVSDVWVAGQHLLDAGTLTRLDWAALAERIAIWPADTIPGERQ